MRVLAGGARVGCHVRPVAPRAVVALACWRHVQEHPRAPQLRPADDRSGDRGAAIQYVRKVSGTTQPSTANQAVFDQAVRAVAAATRTLLDGMVTKAPPRDRAVEAAKARARAAERHAPRTTAAG